MLKGSVLMLSLFVSSAQAGWFGPSNFADCVIDGVKNGVHSDRAASVLYAVCKSKFCDQQRIEEDCQPNNQNLFVDLECKIRYQDTTCPKPEPSTVRYMSIDGKLHKLD